MQDTSLYWTAAACVAYKLNPSMPKKIKLNLQLLQGANINLVNQLVPEAHFIVSAK